MSTPVALSSFGPDFLDPQRLVSTVCLLGGSALALAATIRVWSNDTGTPVPELARTAIR